MIDFKIIKCDSSAYRSMIDLRYRILREPLGLEFSQSDLQKDETDLLLVAFYPRSEKVIACCILSVISDSVMQLRQMAVDNFTQKQGLGSSMLSFAEEVAKNNDYSYLYLHAREEAVGFYKKNGYSIESDRFMEVGIPHFEMLKQINR